MSRARSPLESPKAKRSRRDSVEHKRVPALIVSAHTVVVVVVGFLSLSLLGSSWSVHLLLCCRHCYQERSIVWPGNIVLVSAIIRLHLCWRCSLPLLFSCCWHRYYPCTCSFFTHPRTLNVSTANPCTPLYNPPVPPRTLGNSYAGCWLPSCQRRRCSSACSRGQEDQPRVQECNRQREGSTFRRRVCLSLRTARPVGAPRGGLLHGGRSMRRAAPRGGRRSLLY